MIRIPLYSHNCYASAGISVSRGLKWVAVLGVFVLAGILFRPWLQVSAQGVSLERIIRGIVRDDEGPVSRAIVRIQTAEHSAVTDSGGGFELAVPGSFSGPIKLTAWAKGYFIGGPVEASSGEKDVTISAIRQTCIKKPFSAKGFRCKIPLQSNRRHSSRHIAYYQQSSKGTERDTSDVQ